jgi:hypothetical protein
MLDGASKSAELPSSECPSERRTRPIESSRWGVRGRRDVFRGKPYGKSARDTEQNVRPLSEIGAVVVAGQIVLHAARIECYRERTPLEDGARLVTMYLALKRSGGIAFLAKHHYASRTEAAAALGRLRRLSTVPADAARAARPGGVSAVLAAGLLRDQRWPAPAPPASYTNTGVERRWREASEEQHMELLWELAKGLEFRLPPPASFERLRRAVSAQLEAEFGERARLREAAELQRRERLERAGLTVHDRAPTSEEVAALLSTTGKKIAAEAAAASSGP